MDETIDGLGSAEMEKDLRKRIVVNAHRQLSAARYAYHKQIKTRCFQEILGVDAVERLEKRKEYYAKAMKNYDSVIENAINGSSQEANEADMAKGFE